MASKAASKAASKWEVKWQVASQVVSKVASKTHKRRAPKLKKWNANPWGRKIGFRVSENTNCMCALYVSACLHACTCVVDVFCDKPCVGS